VRTARRGAAHRDSTAGGPGGDSELEGYKKACAQKLRQEMYKILALATAVAAQGPDRATYYVRFH
jgi:hypothetical protein